MAIDVKVEGRSRSQLMCYSPQWKGNTLEFSCQVVTALRSIKVVVLKSLKK